MSTTEVVTETQRASFDAKTSTSVEDKVQTRSRSRVNFSLGEGENDSPPIEKM